MARRNSNNDDESADHDFGIPIPGLPLPPDQWARTAIKHLPPPGAIEWSSWFGRTAPVVLDLGCGNGRFVIANAMRWPEKDFIGLDSLPLVIRYATRRANQRGLHNVRMIVCGAYEFLEQYVGPVSVAEIHLYHPQPFREKRHELAYRRLVSPQFLALVHRSLPADGLFVIQTDNEAYWRYIRRVAPEFFQFEEHPDPWPDAPFGRTRREIYARKNSLKIHRAVCRPRTDLTSEQVAALIESLPLPKFDAGK